jgi:hypothetical protein
MRLTNDDDIYRYEGMFLDMRGTENKFPVRYKVVGVFAAALPVWIVLLRLAGFGPLNFLLFGTTAAVVTSMAVSLYITPEHPLSGRWRTLRAEWVAARLAYARARSPRPVTVRVQPVVRSSR